MKIGFFWALLLALLYSAIVGFALFAVLRWARKERATLDLERPGVKLTDGAAEIAKGRLGGGLKLYLLGEPSPFYRYLAYTLITIVLLAVSVVALFFAHGLYARQW